MGSQQQQKKLTVDYNLFDFIAEMWFGILFAILVEIVPLRVRSTTVGVFLFVMNNIGGNLPIAVEPVSKAIGYRESLYIFYAGFYGISKLYFFVRVCKRSKQCFCFDEQVQLCSFLPSF